MSRLKRFAPRSKTLGLPPGTLVSADTPAGVPPVTVTLIDYDSDTVNERTVADLAELGGCRETPSASWIDVSGVHDIALLETLGRMFGLHPLVLEDITSPSQRPKLEDYSDYVYTVIRMIRFDQGKRELDVEQISLVLGPNWVLSFQERPGDVFDAVRNRIRNDRGRIRKMHADYLFYALFDAVVDNYFTSLEQIGELVEAAEDVVFEKPTPETLRDIHGLRNNVIFLRRSVWPLREVIGALERSGSELFNDETRVFMRDVYDNTIQVIETIETFRDLVSGLFDMYMTGISNRMNEVMKVLTIIATIFIPITFIAGIYGMNFEVMPELRIPWGYPAALAFMAAIAIAMLVYFRRKQWI